MGQWRRSKFAFSAGFTVQQAAWIVVMKVTLIYLMSKMLLQQLQSIGDDRMVWKVTFDVHFCH